MVGTKASTYQKAKETQLLNVEEETAKIRAWADSSTGERCLLRYAQNSHTLTAPTVPRVNSNMST